MKIVLLNLLDSMMSGASSLYIFCRQFLERRNPNCHII